MKIYTKTGDQGETGLFGGGRVPKDDIRVAAYGDVDELNAVLGVARATQPEAAFDPLLEAVQRDLFSIGGYLSTPDPAKVEAALAKAEIPPTRISDFERTMDEADAELPPLRAFVLPAGTPQAAALHHARTVCRRAERSVVHLARAASVPPMFITYLNRLSDLLFTLARLANHRAGVADKTWAVVPDFRITHALGAYAVTVQTGVLDQLPVRIAALWPGRPVALVTDDAVRALMADRLTGGPWAIVLSVPAGEGSKTRGQWAALTDALSEAGLSRDCALVALGGGMVGDLAGFVAATYARGVPYLHAPTTLLSMVDSSIGGKTGVDTPLGKNLVGAFHPPAAVLADPLVLRSLPPEHFRGGLAEMAKHGLIADADYWTALGTEIDTLHAREPEALTRFIARSVEIKAAVVMEDERDSGRRAILNAGHTVAHAVEQLSGFRVSHGDAVAMGLVVEARLAESLGVAVSGLADRVERGLSRLTLPTRLPADMDATQLLDAMRVDKKRTKNELRFSLLHEIGSMAHDADGWTTPVRDSAAIVHALRAAGAV